MVAVPERDPPVLEATFKTTTPPPEPAAPDLTVNHGALLTALQAQLAGALTDTLTLPPVSAGEENVGPIEYVQTKLAWLMLYCWPPAEMVPTRALPAVDAMA
ncbi:MAG: hypothetical protein ABSG41_29625 [Bryobacteraceae bacterium]|jgi:hypothetical protein